MTLISLDHVIVRHSLTHVKELVGNPGVLNIFKKILEKPDKKNTAKVIYQLNLGSRSTLSTPKPVSSLINAKSWGKRYPKEKGDWNGICWVTIESSIEKFLQFVELGFPYRLGIKEGGNSQRHYKGNQGIAFDLDNNPEITLEQTKAKLQELELTGIIHYSPSGNLENNKFRLILFFDQFVEDYSRVNHLVKCLGSLLPNNANNVHDPGRFFYGTILPISHVDYQVNDFKFLYAKYSQILEYVEEKPVQTPLIDLENIDPSGLTIPQRFGLKLSQWLEKSNECLGNLISKICEHFDLTLDNWHLHDSPGTNLEQWRGLDPIHPEKSTTGSSFTVYHAENGTYAYKADRVGAYGDLIDLWFRFSHHSWDINGGVNSRHKQSYWKAFREFCEFLDVDWIKEFDLEQPKEERKDVTPESSRETINVSTAQQTSSQPPVESINVKEAVLGKIQKEVRVLTWRDCYQIKKETVSLNPTRCYLYFLQEHKNSFNYDPLKKDFWIKIDNIWRRKNDEQFKSYLETYFNKQDDLYNEYVEDLITGSFKKSLYQCFSSFQEHFLNNNPEPSWDYLPCKNGVFEVETKKLITYAENMAFLTHQLPYTRKKTTGKGIKALRAFLELFFTDNRAIDDFLLWTAGVVQNQGYKMKQAVCLVGDSGAGKSTLCDLVTNLIAPKDLEYQIPIVKDLDANKVFADDGLFNLQPLEYQRLVVISEFTGFSKNSTQGSNTLKKLVGGDSKGYHVTSPMKHSNNDRTFPFKGAFITNSQNYTKFKADDAGINRRLMIINIQGISGDKTNLFKSLQNFEILEDLWNYFLDFDLVEDVYPRMEELSRADCQVPWKIDSMTLMNQANNKYWTFAQECITIIPPESLSEDAPIPQAPAKQAYETYTRWCLSQGEKYPGTQTAFGLGLTKAIAHFTKLKTDDIKKRTARGVIYQYIQIKTDLG